MCNTICNWECKKTVVVVVGFLFLLVIKFKLNFSIILRCLFLSLLKVLQVSKEKMYSFYCLPRNTISEQLQVTEINNIILSKAQFTRMRFVSFKKTEFF